MPHPLAAGSRVSPHLGFRPSGCLGPVPARPLAARRWSCDEHPATAPTRGLPRVHRGRISGWRRVRARDSRAVASGGGAREEAHGGASPAPGSGDGDARRGRGCGGRCGRGKQLASTPRCRKATRKSGCGHTFVEGPALTGSYRFSSGVVLAGGCASVKDHASTCRIERTAPQGIEFPSPRSLPAEKKLGYPPFHAAPPSHAAGQGRGPGRRGRCDRR
jgi:hypothetical protein